MIGKAINFMGWSEKAHSASAETGLRTAPKWGYLEFFAISQTALPAITYIPGTQPFRTPIRVTAFAISLVALAWWLTRRTENSRLHPAAKWLILVVIWLALMIPHPTTNSPLAGIAQVLLYLSVMAPIFWAPDLVKGPQQLRRLLAILLACNGINSLVGVLQVYDPGTWLPKQMSTVILTSEYGLSGLYYINDSGKLIMRPPGLFDSPGAVCTAGVVAATLGLFFFISRVSWWKRAISVALGATGVTAIYLSQVRTSMLILSCSLVVYGLAVLFLQKRLGRASILVTVSVVLILGGLFYSVVLGGRAVSKRVSTIYEDDIWTVYYNNYRGSQMEQALTELLPSYPIGAGLGRWGMMRYYFGDKNNIHSPMIWAELQVPAWILDGGFILILLYGGALSAAFLYEVRLVKKSLRNELREYAPMILSINSGVLIIIFGFTPFTTQLGMQYWFMAGILYGTARYMKNEELRLG